MCAPVCAGVWRPAASKHSPHSQTPGAPAECWPGHQARPCTGGGSSQHPLAQLQQRGLEPSDVAGVDVAGHEVHPGWCGGGGGRAFWGGGRMATCPHHPTAVTYAPHPHMPPTHPQEVPLPPHNQGASMPWDCCTRPGLTPARRLKRRCTENHPTRTPASPAALAPAEALLPPLGGRCPPTPRELEPPLEGRCPPTQPPTRPPPPHLQPTQYVKNSSHQSKGEAVMQSPPQAAAEGDPRRRPRWAAAASRYGQSAAACWGVTLDCPACCKKQNKNSQSGRACSHER